MDTGFVNSVGLFVSDPHFQIDRYKISGTAELLVVHFQCDHIKRSFLFTCGDLTSKELEEVTARIQQEQYPEDTRPRMDHAHVSSEYVAQLVDCQLAIKPGSYLTFKFHFNLLKSEPPMLNLPFDEDGQPLTQTFEYSEERGKPFTILPPIPR